MKGGDVLAMAVENIKAGIRQPKGKEGGVSMMDRPGDGVRTKRRRQQPGLAMSSSRFSSESPLEAAGAIIAPGVQPLRERSNWRAASSSAKPSACRSR